MRKTVSKAVIVISATILLTFISCKKEPAEPIPVDPVQINLTTNQVSLITSENSFALDIFKKVIENSGETENVIISPLSISSALSMALNGANGATLDAMTETLRLNGLSPEIINESYKNLTEALLKVDSRVLISIANSIWNEKKFVVKKPFADILTQYYSTESKSFDINDPDATKPINDWIDLKTNGLIKNMVDQLDPKTVMLLINAIYFKGKWNSQFDKDKTINESFYKSADSDLQVPMMKQTSDYKIYKAETYTVAEFPYGQGNFAMDVILPDDNNGLKDVLSSITITVLNEWYDKMYQREADVSFPRFKYSYKKELKEILSDMGMGIAFTDTADFSDISDLNIYISFVLHQAFIDNNEEGTEAAAATVIGFENTSVPSGPFILNINHPFVYIIRETTTNSILFMGRVADPSAE